jgi:hypothetical protein
VHKPIKLPAHNGYNVLGGEVLGRLLLLLELLLEELLLSMLDTNVSKLLKLLLEELLVLEELLLL